MNRIIILLFATVVCACGAGSSESFGSASQALSEPGYTSFVLHGGLFAGSVRYTSGNNASTIYMYGSQEDGELGNGQNNGSFVTTPTNVFSRACPACIVQAVSGDNHSLVLTQAGNVYGWGDNSLGQLGLGSTGSAPLPTFLRSGVASIVAGYKSSFIYVNGTGWMAAGQNGFGELGIGNSTSTVSTFTKMALASTPGRYVLSAANDHLLIADNSNNTVQCYGLNDTAQCCLPASNTPFVTSPHIIGQWGTLTGVYASANGVSYFTGTKAGVGGAQTGVWMCGDNALGQAGNGTIGGLITTPTMTFGASPLSNILSFSAGYTSTYIVVIGSDGNSHLYDTGDNISGQLGLGDHTARGSWTDVGVIGAGPASGTAFKVIGNLSNQLAAYYWDFNANNGTIYASGVPPFGNGTKYGDGVHFTATNL